MMVFFRIYIITLAFLTCSFIQAARCSSTETPFQGSSEHFRKNIIYGYSLKNMKNKVLPHAEMWCYAPVTTTSFQHVLKLDISHSYELLRDSLGNQILHFTFSDLSPFSTTIIRIESNLETFSPPQPIQLDDSYHFLQPEKFIQSDHPQIVRLARQLKSNNELQTVTSIFNWITREIKYIGYVKNARGALYALKNKKGDCTEFAYLFVALCRADDIPARAIGGYICPGNCSLRPEGYHNWAEFYHDGAWRIADPQKKIFMKSESQYIAMKVIGNVGEKPSENLQRFRVAGQGLQVRMNCIQ